VDYEGVLISRSGVCADEGRERMDVVDGNVVVVDKEDLVPDGVGCAEFRGQCLNRKCVPTIQLNPAPVCGNGFKEEGEDCDCADAVDANCNCETCKLKDAAVCWGCDPCCDGGQIVPASDNRVCRPSTGPCDPPETCDGTTSTCPTDTVTVGQICRVTRPVDPADEDSAVVEVVGACDSMKNCRTYSEGCAEAQWSAISSTYPVCDAPTSDRKEWRMTEEYSAGGDAFCGNLMCYVSNANKCKEVYDTRAPSSLEKLVELTNGIPCAQGQICSDRTCVTPDPNPIPVADVPAVCVLGNATVVTLPPTTARTTTPGYTTLDPGATNTTVAVEVTTEATTAASTKSPTVAPAANTTTTATTTEATTTTEEVVFELPATQVVLEAEATLAMPPSVVMAMFEDPIVMAETKQSFGKAIAVTLAVPTEQVEVSDIQRARRLQQGGAARRAQDAAATTASLKATYRLLVDDETKAAGAEKIKALNGESGKQTLAASVVVELKQAPKLKEAVGAELDTLEVEVTAVSEPEEKIIQTEGVVAPGSGALVSGAGRGAVSAALGVVAGLALRLAV